MEGRKGAVAVIFVMLVMLQQSAWKITAEPFPQCVADCAISCAGDFFYGGCIAACVAQCAIHTSLDRNHYYCHLGCASSKCSNISTRDNLDGKALESCVNSCSQECKRR